MIEDDLNQCLAQYRSASRDQSASALDEVILAAARRHVQRRRAARATAVTLAVLAVACVSFWNAHFDRQPQVRHDYGLDEGATRYFLSNVAASPYKGPGSKDHSP